MAVTLGLWFLKCQERTAYLVIDGSGYIQMSLATHHSFIVAAQQLQRVPEVAAGFRLSELVTDCPEISEEERGKITIRVQYKQPTQVYWCQNTRCKKVIYSCRQQQWSRAHHIYTLEARIMRLRL